MSLLGSVHLLSALVALLVGALVLLKSPKGTRLHRQLGWTWVVSMLVLNVTALMIYRLFGYFGPFHVAAVVSLATTLLGVWSARTARSKRMARDVVARGRWVARHYYWMTWAYVGLAAAAVAETATRLPAFRPRGGPNLMFGLAVGASALLVVAVGAWLIRSRITAQLMAAGVRLVPAPAPEHQHSA